MTYIVLFDLKTQFGRLLIKGLPLCNENVSYLASKNAVHP